MIGTKKDVQCVACACTKVLSDVHEFAELPVRHNEEDLNEALARTLPWRLSDAVWSSPHTKAFQHCFIRRFFFSESIDHKNLKD